MCALFFIFLLLSKASYVPYGVKPCQKQVTLLEPDLRTELANGNMNQNSQLWPLWGLQAMVLVLGFGGFL